MIEDNATPVARLEPVRGAPAAPSAPHSGALLQPARQAIGLGIGRRFVRNRLAVVATLVLLLICGVALHN